MLLIIVLAFVFVRTVARAFGSGSDDQRVVELEQRVAELERERE